MRARWKEGKDRGKGGREGEVRRKGRIEEGVKKRVGREGGEECNIAESLQTECLTFSVTLKIVSLFSSCASMFASCTSRLACSIVLMKRSRFLYSHSSSRL